jgi:uncharacterized protein involved in type VI secretion and phage assembly
MADDPAMIGEGAPSMINGAATAVVSEVKDPENLGRVQVDLSAHGGAKEWARVVGPNVTIQFGIGDEVLVAFENGDVRSPFVIGNEWDGTDSPPESAGAQTVPTGDILGTPNPKTRDCAAMGVLRRRHP